MNKKLEDLETVKGELTEDLAKVIQSHSEAVDQHQKIITSSNNAWTKVSFFGKYFSTLRFESALKLWLENREKNVPNQGESFSLTRLAKIRGFIAPPDSTTTDSHFSPWASWTDLLKLPWSFKNGNT